MQEAGGRSDCERAKDQPPSCEKKFHFDICKKSNVHTIYEYVRQARWRGEREERRQKAWQPCPFVCVCV